MDTHFPRNGDSARQDHLLATLEGLLAIQATDVKSALDQASDLVARTLGADKVDVFLYDASVDTLVALGTSNTPMGREQKALGLDRLPCLMAARARRSFRPGCPTKQGIWNRTQMSCRASRSGSACARRLLCRWAWKGHAGVSCRSIRPSRTTSPSTTWPSCAPWRSGSG